MGDSRQKVGDMVHKRMLVTDLQTWYPPFIHVGVIAIRHMNRTPAPKIPFVTVIEPLKTMEIMEIPFD